MLSSAGPTASREASLDARDVALASHLHAGDVAALDDLLQCYWRPLVSYAGHLLGNDDAAEDVAQRAFIQVWERRDRIDPPKGVKALVYRIARNIALNEQRAIRVRERWAESAPHLQGPPTADDIVERELESAVRAAIEQLTPRRREAFLLARFDELSYREIGEVMGLSVQTVANHVSAAFAELRRTLAPLLSDTEVKAGAEVFSVSEQIAERRPSAQNTSSRTSALCPAHTRPSPREVADN